MDEYGITLRPQGVEDVHKIVDIEIVLLSLLVVVSLTSVVRANCGGPISTITLQNISSSENTHNIDLISQFIADLRLGDPLEAGEEFFSMFLTDSRLGFGASRPERDLQYHRAKSLTSTLLGTGQFFCKHSEAGTPLLDMKLRGSGQRSGGRKRAEAP